MLIEFRAENFRSLCNEQALTMESSRLGDKDDLRPRTVKGHPTPLLPLAGIYGANGSGKSNVLSAIGFIRDAVIDSHRSWPPMGGVPQNAFAWGSKALEPSLFEISILLKGVRYRYGFVVNHERVLEEWLFAWPKGRKQTWFAREGNNFEFGQRLRGENTLIEQVTRPNSLFLSCAAQHHHEQLSAVYEWFNEMATQGVDGYRERFGDVMPGAVAAAMFAAASASAAASPSELVGVSELLQPFGKQSEAVDPAQLTNVSAESASFRDLLQAADLGIVDVKIEDAGKPDQARRVLVQHRSTSGEAWLPLKEESHGTRLLFRLGPMVLKALSHGNLLLIDELETGLHPLIALKIVDLFNSPLSNPKNAQLLFTTHDSNLLGTLHTSAALRRDQVWLTEKDNNGGTALYPLTSYKPRKSENIERGYLQGRYGAVPFLGDFAQARD